MYIVWAILGFSLIIIVHELGHFALAKFNGIGVEEFSIGMGPKVLSKEYKGTTYSLSLLPIGGYVKMIGEDEESNAENSFSKKSPFRRLTVILAGATMNILLALVILTVYLNHFGYARPTLKNVEVGAPAYEAGIRAGDEIVAIDGSKVFTADDVSVGVYMSKGEETSIKVKRDGEVKEFNLKPILLENGKYKVGIEFNVVKNPSFLESFKESGNQTISLVTQTFKSLKMMVTGQVNFKTDVGGPVTIIKMTGQAAKTGFWNLMYLVAFLSINIGVLNLMPFPALDGGWSIILLIEMITGKKVPDKIVSTINMVGMIILLGFMAVVTIKDILFPINF